MPISRSSIMPATASKSRRQLSHSGGCQLESDNDVYDEAISLDRIMLAIEPAKQLRLVILDACRDNPFAKVMKRTVASPRSGEASPRSNRRARTR